MIHNLAPIILFVYNRPWHTELVLNALAANDMADQSILYIYSDGPKHGALKEDIAKIEKVRRLIISKKWCKEVIIVESAHNKGLADSIVDGVTATVNKHGKIIVLEDDLVTSKGYLQFMNQALEAYKDDSQVMHISGYMYPADYYSNDETFFLNILSCWGWGTWKRAWDYYNHDVKDHLEYFSQSKVRIKKFDIEGNAYFYKQLLKNADGQLYSWAVRWYASWLRAGGYSLFPSRSLVKNIGHDGTGVNCDTNTMYEGETTDYVSVKKEKIIENQNIRNQVDLFYKRQLKQNITAKHMIRRLFKSLLISMGASKIKSGLRWVIRKIYPELAIFETKTVDWTVLVPSIKDSTVSELAKVHPPYHIRDCQVGDYTYIARNSWVSKTSIGKFCSIGPNLVCGWGVHPVDGISTSPMFYSTLKQNGMTLSAIDKAQERKPIKIGNDVFIGMNVTILDGNTIGDGAVIGAGAVVSKDIPPYAIAVGNPIKILRYRFDESTITKLLDIKWWDWPLDKLHEVEKDIFKVDKFVEKYYNY